MESKVIGWVAGIIEGEGFFNTTGVNGGTPVLSIKMTDEDTISKIAKLFKRPYNVDKTNIKRGWSVAYRVNICGSPAIEWIFTIYSLMSNRRKSQMLDLIDKWKVGKSRSLTNFGCGHPKTPENSWNRGRYVECRICGREKSKERWAREKANAIKEIKSA